VTIIKTDAGMVEITNRAEIEQELEKRMANLTSKVKSKGRNPH